MTYNFDTPVNRHNSDSMKWLRYPKNVIPLWVADMDFVCSQPILDSLQRLVDHGVIGYTLPSQEIVDVVVERLKTRHNWEVKPEWIVWLPGLVPGLHAAVRSIDEANYFGVMTSTPVYKPFIEAAEIGKRRLMDIPFVWNNGRWEMDFAEMERQITPDVKIYMLCNPHNPLGRVFDEDELQKLANFCLKHNLVLCADEIHCDLILDDTARHISVATLNKAIENQSITLLAPSKTFNIAGLGCSLAVIPNDELRANFQRVIYGIIPRPTGYSLAAALAAYRDSAEWYEQVIPYLKGNYDFLVNEFSTIDGLQLYPLEATYLAWIGYDDKKHPDLVKHLENFGVGVMDADIFGGKAAFRLNFATQRSILAEAVRRIREAMAALA